MRQLTDEGERALGDIAGRHAVSLDAIGHLLAAVVAGGSTQAQFNHPELGGMGQWSEGGMIMVGDMFNTALKARVDALCMDLARLVRGAEIFRAPPQSGSQGDGASLFVPATSHAVSWWPAELGQAASTGSQNSLRYAVFPQSRRLAIDLGGRVRIYDTGDHQIGGFSQQQGGSQSLSFTSQYGLVDLSSLPEVTTTQADRTPTATTPVFDKGIAAEEPHAHAVPRLPPAPDDIFDKIERLAGLHAKGFLTDEEFNANKTELLSRL